MLGVQAKKQRRQHERRSSKGHRLRFNVQQKLVSFMAPVGDAAPPLALQLFPSLFGVSAPPVVPAPGQLIVK